MVGVTEGLERRDQMVRVRVAASDLEAWRRAAGPLGGPLGGVSGWLRSAASKACATHMTVAGSELARGVPVEVVELRASASEAASWREAAGDDGVAAWLRGVAGAELAHVGAPVPPDVKLDSGGPGSTAAPAPRSDADPPADTPVPSTDRTAAPVTSGAPSRPFAGEDAEDRRRRSMTIVDVLACPHPPEDLKRLPYMVMCVRCGRRMEGRDRFTGGGYAAWTPGWREACPHPEAERVARPWGPACLVCGSSVRG